MKKEVFMKVLKIELEGIINSFRYPHFLVGRQPSYRMPPPSTIYGLICSAVGEWVEPDNIRFGYYFTYHGIGDDLEHIHLAMVSTSRKIDKKWGYSKNIEVEINPIKREILFAPKIILYLNVKDKLNWLYNSFRSPYYPLVLGRSQDLVSCKKVDIVELQDSVDGYIEKTLLPWNFALNEKIPGIVVLMPKFINPQNRRNVVWEKYVVCEHKIHYSSKNPIQIDSGDGMKRIIIWHSFQ